MLKGGEHVLLAVSGGPDSLTLLNVFARLAPERRLSLHVAHFDHRLRDGSDDDAAFVKRQAARLGIPVTIGVADETAPIRGMSPEEAARSRRLRFLAGVAAEIGAARVATGHTLDDQAETVLMRLLTGAGRRGLSGIPPVRWWYIRPLIDVRRSEVEAFCRALRLRPRIDPTNDDPAFLRNLIRHQTLPALGGTLDARLPEALARMADVLRDEDYLLDRTAAERAAVHRTDDGSAIGIDLLRELPAALQRRAIRLLARTEGDGIDFAATEAVRRLALSGTTGKSLDLPGDLRARVEYGVLVLGPAPSPEVPATSVELDVPGETDLLRWSLRARAWITARRPNAWPDGRGMCVLDADRVPFPLRVRRWRAGDRFRPLGMSRQKKVGDFFTDARVPRGARARVPLVVDAEDRIVWVVGHRIDDRAKVTDATARALWLAIQDCGSR